MCLGAGLAPSKTFFFTTILQWFHVLPMSLANTHLTPNALDWETCPQPSSSAWWPAEVRLTILCSHYQTSLPLWLIKSLNCRWRHLLSQKERGSQMCAALR